VSFRARLVTYFVVVHLALAGLGGWLVWTEPYALIGVEVALIASLAIGVGLVRRAIGYRALAADARRLVHDQAFTSRFLPVGEPDVDELIALYNRMVDRLRDERVRLAEQHQFLAQVLAVSPSGIVVLGFDGEVTSLNPAAARWLQAQPWPGNVRQLQQAVERAVLVDTRDRLDVESFTDLAATPGREAADSLPEVGAMTIDEIERAMILKSLRHHGGNISRVAESLGLSRPALYRRFEKYEITV